jgi:hypothetical protein
MGFHRFYANRTYVSECRGHIPVAEDDALTSSRSINRFPVTQCVSAPLRALLQFLQALFRHS